MRASMKLVVKKSSLHGKGLFAGEDIPWGAKIIEYSEIGDATLVAPPSDPTPPELPPPIKDRYGPKYGGEPATTHHLVPRPAGNGKNEEKCIYCNKTAAQLRTELQLAARL